MTTPAPGPDDITRQITTACELIEQTVPHLQTLPPAQLRQAVGILERAHNAIDQACDALERTITR